MWNDGEETESDVEENVIGGGEANENGEERVETRLDGWRKREEGIRKQSDEEVKEIDGGEANVDEGSEGDGSVGCHEAARVQVALRRPQK